VTADHSSATDRSNRLAAVAGGAPRLRATGIVKSFGDVNVLRGVEFEVRPGEVHALLGGNGAGKSTLMKVLEGVHQPDAGTIELDGERVAFHSPHAAREHGMSMVFQEFSLVPSLSVSENLSLGAEPRSAGGFLDDGAARRAARDRLGRLNADIDPVTPVHRLATAYWQLIEIAKALTPQTRVLIMDEPTASLASNEVERLFELIRRLRGEGIAIIYISHRLEEISQVADRVSILRDGQMVATENIADVTIDRIIEHMTGEQLVKADETRSSRPAAPKADGERPLLSVEGLASRSVIHDVSFTVRPGEVLGLVGLMGSGRTEVARALFGIDRITAGTVRLEGTELTLRSPRDAIDAGIVLVPEDRRLQGLVLMHAVESNLLLPLYDDLTRNGLIDDGKGRSIYQRFAQRLNIKTASPKTPARQLSGGNQQKIVMAKWLASEPKLLILDEPSAGVDIPTRNEIGEIIRSLTAEGKAVILISSDLAEVLDLADRLVVLRDGHVARELPRDDVQSEPELHRLVQVA
jgi:ribose transport system ATP-binding protein